MPIVPAQEIREPPSFKPSVKRVAVFKNGYAFTYREGQAVPVNGWVYTTDVPIGVMGTVWGYTTSPQARVTQLLASEADKKEANRVANLEELLFVNEGSRIRVKPQNSDKILEGTYVILNPRRTFLVGETHAPLRDTGAERIANGESDIAITTETGVTVMRTSNITFLEFVGQPRWDKLMTSKENRLLVKTENVPAGQSIGIGIAALERGIRWIPAYRIEPKGDPVTEAKLELEAMVINELTDISNAEFYFVVGVPHFLYQDLISPLSLTQTFAGVSSYFNVSQNQYSNAIMTQSRAGELRPSRNTTSEPSATVPEEGSLPAMSADELYLYRSDQIALKKGERASLRLFSLTVPCREVFEWDVPETSGYGEYSTRSLTNLSGGFWRSLKLKNETGMPWTTAPAITFRDWKPLGQDFLAFTPVNTETTVRVTPATEVVGTHKMEEKSRIRQVIRPAKADGTAAEEYDLITVEGTIKLRNVKKQPVDVVITRKVGATIIEASKPGAISRDGADLQAMNPNSVVRWEMSLPPGEMQLRYVYKIYVAR
ncbi:MAG: hypothetical protein H7Y30_04745 [Pyrinomonadaceae bacterium]|nr:hypothetical protein [Pyrinomonadaceae bacterium]